MHCNRTQHIRRIVCSFALAAAANASSTATVASCSQRLRLLSLMLAHPPEDERSSTGTLGLTTHRCGFLRSRIAIHRHTSTIDLKDFFLTVLRAAFHLASSSTALPPVHERFVFLLVVVSQLRHQGGHAGRIVSAAAARTNPFEPIGLRFNRTHRARFTLGGGYGRYRRCSWRWLLLLPPAVMLLEPSNLFHTHHWPEGQ
uniref:Secreted protein n=1 Tax=Anopheles merus TaxID=30066 RepID=A0A182V3B6_ANOME